MSGIGSGCRKPQKAEDTGLEQPSKILRKPQVVETLARNAARLEPSRDENTVELVAIFRRLDDAGRADLLAVARGPDAKAVTK